MFVYRKEEPKIRQTIRRSTDLDYSTVIFISREDSYLLILLNHISVQWLQCHYSRYPQPCTAYLAGFVPEHNCYKMESSFNQPEPTLAECGSQLHTGDGYIDTKAGAFLCRDV